MHGLLVLKIGGSVLEAGRLGAVLEAVTRRQRPVVVVPGGGPFADEVRRAQEKFGFSDAIAHRLALLSMHQMAHVFAETAPRLVPAETCEDFARSMGAGLVPVWMPEALAGDAADVVPSWDTTSDGLAAWLAVRLGCAEVCLVKSCPVAAGASLTALADAGVVDRAFVALVTRHGLTWSVLGDGDDEQLATLLGTASDQPGADR